MSHALTLRNVTAAVRACNEHFDGPAPVALVIDDDGSWSVEALPPWPGQVRLVCGREEIPGDGRPCDATACARRLLAAFRDAH